MRRFIPLGWILVAVAGFLCTFVLPFQFPLKEPVLSAAYQMGANNRAAEVSLAMLSVLVALAALWFGLGEPVERRGRPGPGGLRQRYLWIAIAVICLWTAVLGSLVAHSGIFWGDEGYFLNQLRTGLLFHRAIYQGFEFPYGPALYLWPAGWVKALGVLGLGRAPAYLVSVAAMQALGLGLLYYLVNALPLERPLKVAAFAIFALAGLNPFLGINYTIFRFLLPLATVALLCRCKDLGAASAVAGLGTIAQFAVSPELAVSFGGAAVVYGLYRTWITGRAWLLVSGSAMAGALIFAVFAGKAYFLTMAGIAKGGFNLLLQPMPHLLILLVALLALAPIAVGRALSNRDAGAGLLLALYIASLGLLPAAMGRSDAVHLLMNGMGIYLLSLVAVPYLGRRGATVWVGAVVFAILLTQGLNLRAYTSDFRRILHRAPEATGIDLAALESAIGTQPVSAPANAPPPVIDALTARGLYRPGFYCGLVGVWDHAAEERIVAEMRGDAFTLLPSKGVEAEEPLDTSRFKQALRLGYAYRQRHPPVVIGPWINAEIRENWMPVKVFGYYTLYRRVR